MAKETRWMIIELLPFVLAAANQVVPADTVEPGDMVINLYRMVDTDRPIKNRADGIRYLRGNGITGRFHCVPTKGAFEITEVPVTEKRLAVSEVE